MLNGDAMENPI